jgi:hypothetical protein
MKVKKVYIAKPESLEAYISLHKGLIDVTDKECAIIAAILSNFPEGVFSRYDKKVIYSAVGENGTYLNVYLDRLTAKGALSFDGTKYSLNKLFIPEQEEALAIIYGIRG